jgi:predicted Fe-Mo cluster-binding NifX family protein/NAD-dependent dihydropyrimidine dehydrogenase PreA subunit
MKICVSSQGNNLDSEVDPRFGRCQYFIVIDTDTMKYEAFENSSAALGGGAGIQSAQFVSGKGVESVLTGNCGPNAFQVFDAAGIKVITGVSGKIKDAVEKFKQGLLSASTAPNVASHSGMGQNIPGAGKGFGGVGRGQGRRGSFSGKTASPSSATGKRAYVDVQTCTGCGACDSICPEDAITLDAIAEIDIQKCTGCGICVDACVVGAITIK